MRKNLLIGCVGPTSLHNHWIDGERNFDFMVIDYGDNEIYSNDGEYYLKAKGTKFNIIHDVLDKIPDYDYIFIPDDDLYLTSKQINHLFEIGKNYNLDLFQPSLIGYYSVFINLHVPGSILRYTNYVEIIAPCFSKYAFHICKSNFNYSKSCWGIDIMWNKLLGYPKDKIAIVDDVIAAHTRACFCGDYYRNNSINNSCDDLKYLIEKNGLSYEKIVYDTVKKEEDYQNPSEFRIHPNVEKMHYFTKSLSRKFFI